MDDHIHGGKSCPMDMTKNKKWSGKQYGTPLVTSEAWDAYQVERYLAVALNIKNFKNLKDPMKT